jgi:hypothetical protein
MRVIDRSPSEDREYKPAGIGDGSAARALVSRRRTGLLSRFVGVDRLDDTALHHHISLETSNRSDETTT